MNKWGKYYILVILATLFLLPPGVRSQTQPNSIIIEGHECVDLDLPSGTLWATCNLGADSVGQRGSYFAWAETNAKASFFQNNCSTYRAKIEEYSRNSEYDAATVLWGAEWSTPTIDQMTELINNCTWSWVDDGDSKGYLVAGQNGNKIFLPAAGWFEEIVFGANQFGCYWTSTPHDFYTVSGYRLEFSDNSRSINRMARYNGLSIRPVTKSR